jgi:hypothetical protein
MPAILVDQETWIDPTTLSFPAHAIQVMQDGLGQCGDTRCIVEAGTHIGNATLQGRKARAYAQVPPDERCIGDYARLPENPDLVFVVGVIREACGQSGTRKPIEYCQSV